jgi:hypothetical protein
VARSAASRRGYRDDPPRPSAAGSAFVLTLGILLIVAAHAGGYVLKWRSDLVSVDDEPAGTVDVAQVCTSVIEHNTKYRKQITDTLQVGVQAVLDGDEAAAKKVETDIAAMAKDWAGKLRDESARTDNAELRDAISGLATKLKPVESGEASLNDMNTIVDESSASIGKYCPGAAPTTTTTP